MPVAAIDASTPGSTRGSELVSGARVLGVGDCGASVVEVVLALGAEVSLLAVGELDCRDAIQIPPPALRTSNATQMAMNLRRREDIGDSDRNGEGATVGSQPRRLPTGNR